MQVFQFVADALGDSSYLLVSEGRAAAVDPQRDVRPLVAAAEAHGATIEFVFETHVHNDYLSGGRELAALGARVVAPAKAHLAFPHLPIEDEGEIAVGGATVRAVLAPGHTYEHTAYIGLDERRNAQAAFTGGALLMGSAGRSDLLGPDHTAELTRLQWESAQRIRNILPAAASLFPTHGAGSFCSTTGSAMERSGPLSVELQRNPALTTHTSAEFSAIQLASASPIPGYYPYMAPINRSGPKVFGTPPRPRLLSIDDVAGARETVIDIRPRQVYSTAHIPGSIEIEESNSLLAYVGWVVPFNSPIVLIAEDQAQAERVTLDLFRIGYEDVRGYLPFSAWTGAGRAVESLPHVDARRAREMFRDEEMAVMDTRFSSEQFDRPIPGALRLPFDELSVWAESAPARGLVVCASGQRATMAASILKRDGRDVIALVEGGAEDLLAP